MADLVHERSALRGRYAYCNTDGLKPSYGRQHPRRARPAPGQVKRAITAVRAYWKEGKDSIEEHGSRMPYTSVDKHKLTESQRGGFARLADSHKLTPAPILRSCSSRVVPNATCSMRPISTS